MAGLPWRPRFGPAFTLIEILGVLSVLAILASLLIPVLQRSRAAARTARAKSDMAKIESALNLFKLDSGSAPTAADAGLILVGADGDFTVLDATSAGPLSPSTQQPYLEVPDTQINVTTRQFLDPWKTPYWIKPVPTHNLNAFDIFSAGPDKAKNTADDINNWSR